MSRHNKVQYNKLKVVGPTLVCIIFCLWVGTRMELEQCDSKQNVTTTSSEKKKKTDEYFGEMQHLNGR